MSSWRHDSQKSHARGSCRILRDERPPASVGDMKQEAWTTEDNILFVTTGGDIISTVGLANKALAEYGYEFHLTVAGFNEHMRPVWVDPEHFYEERWPRHAYSPSPVAGWYKLFRIDLEDVL